ncbi:MAG: helix-turn-helix transcriptional regulator [Acidobacteriota bacterium]
MIENAQKEEAPAAQGQASKQLPLTPQALGVLIAVADQPRHGYAIMQEVTQRTGGSIQLLPGSLYSTIKRMLSAGLIEECEAADGEGSKDPRRRYYCITAAGRQAAQAELKRMQRLLEMGREKKLALGE